MKKLHWFWIGGYLGFIIIAAIQNFLGQDYLFNIAMAIIFWIGLRTESRNV